MNDTLTRWLQKPNNLLGVLHAVLAVVGFIAIRRFDAWSLWLILLLAIAVAAIPTLTRWLDDDLVQPLQPVLHGALSAVWGLSFFSVFSGNWPVILFIAGALVLAYLILPERDFRLRAAGMLPVTVATAVALISHGYYLSGLGLLLLLGLVLWRQFLHDEAETWGDVGEGDNPQSDTTEPVLTPPAGPDPRQEAVIGELKNRIRALETELSSAEMTKMEFLATMSHEIRTPLNGIIPLLDILLDSDLSDFQKDYLQTAFVSAKQMQKLIDDLLDYSKVEAGKLSIENVGLKLPRVLESVVKALEPSAQKKNLRIQLDVSPYVSPLLRGDPLRVRQVVTNLLSNAIKFSDRGTIHLGVSKVKDLGDKELVRIEVRDEGIGIAPEQQAVLFQPFTQADGSSTRKFGGTGIGLAISKKIVELMDGRIGVESEPGKGSTFFVELPLLKPAHQTPTQEDQRTEAASSTSKGFQALILNTSFSATQSLQRQLTALGIHAKPSNSLSHIQESLNAARQLNGNSNHFLVFVDFDTAAKQARALIAQVMDEETPSDFTACIITAQQRIAGVPQSERIQLLGPNSSVEELLRRLEEGAGSSTLTTLAEKPQSAPGEDQGPVFGGLSLEEGEEDSEPETTATNPAERVVTGVTHSAAETLAETEQTLSDTSAQAENSPPKETPADIPQLDERVLLVEDNDVNLKVAQKLIQYIGYTFDVAKNGLEALEKVKQNRYRMVLMDCQMPVMDGYLCTQRIREYEKAEGLNSTPIIAMTANAMMGDREKCLNAGMDDYMSKPLNRYVLEKTLKKWDPLQATPVTNSNPAAAKRQPAAPAINDKWLSTKTLHEIREFMGDDVQSLLSLFKQDAPGTLRHMRKALQSRNLAELRTLAHSLKSSSANIGARGLSYFCKRMEAEALSGDMERLNALMENIKKSYLLTVREIDKYGQPPSANK